MPQIHKIVLTGGPCAGKTTALPFLVAMLKAKGWKIYTVPETATLLSNNGVDLVSETLEERLEIQTGILNLQTTLEDAMMNAAKASGKNCVIICDRGIMDAKAYTPPEAWQPYLDAHGWGEVSLRDRYDAVFHLTSAAIGASEFYNNDNPARFEDVKMAVGADRRTQDSWVGHPHLRVIDNSTNFPNKIARLCAAVESFLSPDHKEIERRFLIDQEDLASLELNRTLLPIVTLEIAQAYLKTVDGTVARMRQTSQAGSNHVVYTHTTKSPKVGASCTEIETRITQNEFNDLKFLEDQSRAVIFKRRHCFLWHGKHMQLDEFISPVKDMLILEVELDTENEEFNIPPFLAVTKEVTTDPTYSNWNIAAYGRDNVVAANQ